MTNTRVRAGLAVVAATLAISLAPLTSASATASHGDGASQTQRGKEHRVKKESRGKEYGNGCHRGRKGAATGARKAASTSAAQRKSASASTAQRKSASASTAQRKSASASTAQRKSALVNFQRKSALASAD